MIGPAQNTRVGRKRRERGIRDWFILFYNRVQEKGGLIYTRGG